MERFDIGQVYALHNAPGLAEGAFHTTPGPIMAAVDTFEIHIQGVGGHGAMPHETRDPVMAACGIAQAIQTIVSRNHYALDDLVVSVTQIHTGTVNNVIPDTAYHQRNRAHLRSEGTENGDGTDGEDRAGAGGLLRG